jgi:hypothetical protein
MTGHFEGDLNVIDQRNVMLVLVIDNNGLCSLTPGCDDAGNAVIDRNEALELIGNYLAHSRKEHG